MRTPRIISARFGGAATRLRGAATLLAGALLTTAMLAAAACSTPVVPQAGPPQTTSPSPPAPAPATTSTTAPANRPSLPPTAAVPGLSDETIRIAVIADVETGGFADGRSRSVWGAISAWATELRLFGGLAGREVEVAYIDTGLFNHATAIAQVCEGDFFAVVGSDALLDNEGIDRLGGPDCPVLNFPAVAHSPQHQNRPGTYMSNPQPVDTLQIGPLRWLAETNPEAVASAGLPLMRDLQPALIGGEKLQEGALAAGYTIAANPEVELLTLLCAPEDLYGQLARQEVRALLWPTYGTWLAQLINSRGQPDSSGVLPAGQSGADADQTAEPGGANFGSGASTSTDPDPGANTDSPGANTDSPGANTDSPGASQPAQSFDGPSPVQQPSTSALPDTTTGNLFCPAFSADDAIAEAQAQAQTQAGADASPDPDSEAGTSETEAEADTPASLNLEFTLCNNTCHSTQTTSRLTDGINTGIIENPNLMTWTHLYPLEEAEANSELRQYVILLQLIGDSLDGQPFEPDLQGLAAWSAGRLFEQAVRLAVENWRASQLGPRARDFGATGSAPALTQQAVAEAVESITDWTSNGLHAPTNPAQKEPTACFALLAWNPQQASWQRQHPATPGQWDCRSDNLYTLQITSNLGLEN